MIEKELLNELESGEIDAKLVSNSPIAKSLNIKLSFDGLTQEKLNFIKTAIKKQIPQKVLIKDWGKDIKYVCPVCESFAIRDYCAFCGQKLDWSDADV